MFIPIDGSFENPLFEHDTNSNAKKMWIKMLEKEGLCTDSKGVDIGTLFDCVKHAFEREFGWIAWGGMGQCCGLREVHGTRCRRRVLALKKLYG